MLVTLFLDLMQLQRCDTETIFKSFETNLLDRGVEIQWIKFTGMDGCSAMSGEQNGMKAHFQNFITHFNYIHCRNYHLAWCFTHLIPQFDEFKNFDSLLLNLYLLLKNNSMKQSIFNEVQCAYGLDSLKLIKDAVTCWHSHGTAAQLVFDRFEPLVASIDAMCLWKFEPAVRGLCDSLVQSNMIATLCFLSKPFFRVYD